MTGLLETPDKVFILHKGEDAMREEYSVFRNSAAAGKNTSYH